MMPGELPKDLTRPTVTTSSPVDGIHLDADRYLRRGREITRTISAALPERSG